jgi:cell division protein FtsA
MSKDAKDLIVGLDIGTSKVVAAVAELMPDGRYEIIGIGRQDSKGLRKGVVVNIETTVAAIQRALEEAELMADCKIRTVYTGIAGSHIHSFNSHGMVAIKDREVTQADVARVVETAKAINIPTDQQILHVLTQEFIVDNQEDVREPLGMSGVRLEVKVHIVTGAVSAAQNIVKCVRRCGLEVHDLVLQPLASSLSVLTADEKDLGVVLVDIGGGTTDVAVFHNGAIRHTAVIPIAGDHITNDIAMALRTPIADAEDMKLRHGIAKESIVDPEAKIEVAGIGDRGSRTLSKQSLAAVIEPRIAEIFEHVADEIRSSGYAQLISSGIVLTGAASQMRGMSELAEEIFAQPIRIGVPMYQGGMADVVCAPSYASVIGLLNEARAQHVRGQRVIHQSGAIKGSFQRMKEWFAGNF